MGNHWVKRELELLRKYYFSESSVGVQKRLLQEGFIRTIASIQVKAKRSEFRGNVGGFVNLVGRRFIKLVVKKKDLNYTFPSGSSRIKWECECDCGRVVSVFGNDLISGHTKSCGHCNDIIIGKRYNKWLEPIERIEGHINSKGHHLQWFRFKCHYGAEGCKGTFPARANSVLRGLTTSCGCLHKEMISELGKKNRKEEGNHISSLAKRYYKSLEYRKMQNEQFDRDNNCCIILGKLPRKLLTVHHIIPRNYYFKKYNITTWEQVLACKELWNINNLVTISEEWHIGIKIDNPKALHKIYHGRIYVEEDYYGWLQGRTLILETVGG